MSFLPSLNKRISELKNSSLLKNFLVLLSGSVIAQAIQLALSPLLSRIFSPSEFGVFSVFFSLSYFIYAISSLRLDYSIIMQKNKNRALNMALNSFLISTIFSILFIVFFAFSQTLFINVIKIPKSDYYWFAGGLFLTILIFSYSSIMSYYFNHQKKYSIISTIQVIRVTSTISLQLIAGYFFESKYGLIYGLTIGVIFSFIYVLYKFSSKVKFPKIYNKKYSKLLIKKNIAFLKYNTPHVIIDNIMMHGFILYLSYTFSTDDVGSYGFANRIVRAPILLIGSTLGRIMFKQLAEAYHSKKSFKPLIKSTKKIISIVIIPALLIIPFIEDIFIFLFGESWQLAATISFYIFFPSILNLILLPFVNIAYVLNKNKPYFYLSMINLAIILSTIILNHIFNFNFENYIKLYTLFLSITICITAYWLITVTNNYERKGIKK